ncbi:Ku protein [Streptomyces sp. NPDC002758]
MSCIDLMIMTCSVRWMAVPGRSSQTDMFYSGFFSCMSLSVQARRLAFSGLVAEVCHAPDRPEWRHQLWPGHGAVHVVNATEDHSIRFHQVDLDDTAPVRVRKYCELEGLEVTQGEIRKGYPLGKKRSIRCSTGRCARRRYRQAPQPAQRRTRSGQCRPARAPPPVRRHALLPSSDVLNRGPRPLPVIRADTGSTLREMIEVIGSMKSRSLLRSSASRHLLRPVVELLDKRIERQVRSAVARSQSENGELKRDIQVLGQHRYTFDLLVGPSPGSGTAPGLGCGHRVGKRAHRVLLHRSLHARQPSVARGFARPCGTAPGTHGTRSHGCPRTSEAQQIASRAGDGGGAAQPRQRR